MAKKSNGSKGIAAGADGVGQRDSSTPEGADPSNTAPHNCNWTDDLRILRSGVDTLVLSFTGELSDESVIRLKQLKELAQSEDKGEQAYAQWELGEELFSVAPHGSGGFPFLLLNPLFRVSLSNGLGAMPLAYIQIYSELLTKSGVNTAIERIVAVLRRLVVSISEPRISRIDICVDFATTFDMESINRRQWIGRANRISNYAEGDEFTGWTIGLKGPVAARLYDKSIEITVSDKYYMQEFWRECGWDGKSPVWRLEFEVKREAFRQFEVDHLTMAELCAGLWSYLTSSWLRLAVESVSDETRSRWSVHPLWQQLSAVDFGVFDVPSFQRVRNSNAPSRDWMFRAGSAGIFAFMAMEGIDDLREGCEKYRTAFLDYLDHYEDVRGASTQSLILEKLRILRRRHNLALNRRAEHEFDPVKKALADFYRRGKDGE